MADVDNLDKTMGVAGAISRKYDRKGSYLGLL